MSREMRWLTCACALVLLAGCSGTSDPAIRVAGARLDAVTDEALTLQIALTLQNPNPQPLELLEFKYRVEVDGRQVYSGTRAAEMTLQQLTTREVEIPAVVALGASPDGMGWSAQALPAAVEYRVTGSLRYLLPGAIAQTLFDTRVRRPSASLAGHGIVTLQRQ